LLPNDVVLAKTVSCFKIKLDELWQYQDVKYDFQVETTVIGNQSNM